MWKLKVTMRDGLVLDIDGDRIEGRDKIGRLLGQDGPGMVEVLDGCFVQRAHVQTIQAIR